jgi:predicted DNA-binding protein with PD1-like motif
VVLLQYSEGKIDRIFILRIDDGEDLIESILEFVHKKNLKSCIGLFIGALKDGKVVTGPKSAVLPPEQHFESYSSAWEVFGMITIFSSTDGPKIHIHSALGRGREALVGCLRDNASVYLVNEVMIFEFTGLDARKEIDERTGLYLLSLDRKLRTN